MVEMNNSYYKMIYERFEEDRPDVAKFAKRFYPRGDHSIRVETDDGFFDYNYIRGVGQYVREKPTQIDDITTEYSHRRFSEKLRDMMARRGYSQKSLAQASGLSEGIISKYLRSDASHGERARKTPVSPSYNALLRICHALGCEPYELL
jgi:DNA-binding Xre family transcriptional regulator